MKRKAQPMSVKIYPEAYQHLKAFLKTDPLAPSILAVISAAVEDWIKKNNPAGKPRKPA